MTDRIAWWPGRRPPGAAVRWVLLVAATVIATVALAAVGVPSAALFAGLVMATALALVGLGPSRVFRGSTAAAQAVIGVVIGLLARPDTLAAVASDWLPVLLVSIGTLAASMAAGLAMGVQRGVSPLTGVLAQTAGGASGLVAISRDLGGDERVVSVVQSVRVGLVTATMPVVAVLGYGATHVGAVGSPGPAEPAAPGWVAVLVVLGCAGVGIPLARVLRLPAGSLLGPMVLAMGLGLSGLLDGVSVPALIVDVAYAVIGWQAGLRFTREALATVVRVLPLATALILAVVVLCAGLGLVLSWTTRMTPLKGYLATTPGGIYAVLATAISSGVDVTTVMAAQVIRVLLMLLIAPLLARFLGRGSSRRSD